MKYWDAPWNPEIGCTACSPGCRGCYANTLHTQRHKALLAGKKMPECYREPFNVIQLLKDRLDIPMRRRIPTVYFVCDMGDLFHPKVPFEFIDKVLLSTDPIFSPNHTFLILTKRVERMKKYFEQLYIGLTKFHKGKEFAWPPQNIWLGVTICNQDEKDKIDILRQTPAAHRFLSFEPLLEDLGELNLEDIDQVILGGETGPKARPMHPDWARKVRDQCKEAGVPFYFKQWGEWLQVRYESEIYKQLHCNSKNMEYADYHHYENKFYIHCACAISERPCFYRIGKKKAGRKLDGEEHNELAWRLAK